MTRPSPPRRRPQPSSSPDRGLRSSFLLDQRNTESSHLGALAAAQAEHDRVREAAIRVYELHELKEEHQRILDQERWEQERLRAEAQVAAEERRLQELRAKSIPKPAPPPELEPSRPVEQLTADGHAAQASSETKGPVGAAPRLPEVKPQPPTAPQPNGLSAGQNQLVTNSLPAVVAPKPSALQQVAPPSVAPPQPKAAPPQPSAAQAQPQARRPVAMPVVDRYLQIHQELKSLRRDLMAQSKLAGSPLKGKMGTFRREIRVAIGQLTGVRSANVQPTGKITSILRESLDGRVPSPPVEVSRFVAAPREPAEGVPNNDAAMPSLFIYLVNICAKGIISQFINECGANPKAADPIGVFTAHLFSQKDFQWRGQSLIDILLAKFRVACPVLFGFRGSDKMEKGRLAIGWRKDGPGWITEQSHNDRMAGLGAGFAAVSLRDFSKTSKTNPYPPTHYWRAFAAIVNSPANETSNTQYVVLRSMIEGQEQRFLSFYGNAAVAALRLALVEFPKRAPQNAPAAESLRALAEVLRTEYGLALA